MLVVPRLTAISSATCRALAMLTGADGPPDFLPVAPRAPRPRSAALLPVAPGAEAGEGETMSWLEGRFGPTLSRTLLNRAVAATQMMAAISVLRLVAASAVPARARERAGAR